MCECVCVCVCCHNNLFLNASRHQLLCSAAELSSMRCQSHGLNVAQLKHVKQSKTETMKRATTTTIAATKRAEKIQ